MGEPSQDVIADRYLLERELGEGGMATVWLARDSRHDCLVAIKVIRPALAGAIGVDRFLREVQLTARLRHPHIVPLLDSGQLQAPDGTVLPWYAMSYLEGESLRGRLSRERQLPLEDALRITEDVGTALQAAHDMQVVHRDIKPENILLAGASAYVVDFGIAKALMDTSADRLTSTGVTIGTPAYMSPEQAAGDQVDARCDQYSLATVLYEMLTGETPFSGSTAQALLGRRLAEPARPIRSVRPGVPEPIERAVLRALERAPGDRFPHLAAFIAELRSTSIPIRRPGRRILLAAVGVVTLIAAAGLGLAMLRGSQRERTGHVTRDTVAVALYQRAMRGLGSRTDEGATDALASFQAALARDSTYGAAWAGLAELYTQIYGRRFIFSGEAGDSIVRLAVAAGERATALNGQDPEVLLAQALVAGMVDPTNLDLAVSSLRRAVAADPRNVRAWHNLAINLYSTGDGAGAIDAWRRAILIDPTFAEGLAFLALGFMWARQYDSAAFWADRAIRVNPSYLLARQAHGNIEVERGDYDAASADFDAARRLGSGVEVPNALAGSALVAARAGRRTDAAHLLRQAEALMVPYTPIPLHNAVYTAAAYAALGDRVRAVDWLERFSPRASLHFQLHIRCDPALDPIADDARFLALLRWPRPGASGC